MKSNFSAKPIIQLMKTAENKLSYKYPWDGLEGDIKSSQGNTIKIIGYGSLVNVKSASYTLNKRVLDTFKPIIAFGAKRFFNYVIPDSIDRYKNPENDNERAALNVQLTENFNDIVNGVIMELSLEDIQPMRERELGYDLVQIPCLYWNEKKEEPFLAYILRCKDEKGAAKKYTDEKIMPHRQYYTICKDGAAGFGQEFLNIWLETTFLADTETSVAVWETQNT